MFYIYLIYLYIVYVYICTFIKKLFVQMKYILIHVKATRLIQSSAVSDFLFFFYCLINSNETDGSRFIKLLSL